MTVESNEPNTTNDVAIWRMMRLRDAVAFFMWVDSLDA
jgi:hypothetical protein